MTVSNNATVNRAIYFVLFLHVAAASAQLVVSVSPVKATGSKAVVPLAMKNGFAERIESARAVCFLLDDQGKVVVHSTQWVIGAGRDKSPLGPGATNVFNFVVATAKPLTTTSLTAKVSFSRVVLEGGKLADVNKEVQIQNTDK
jgi:hypothetical protein